MDVSSDSGSMMQQAQQIWNMLDDMAQNNPQAYRKFIDKQMNEAKELRQPPLPHMCVLTKNLKSMKSLYVNVCSWNKIPAPKSETAPIPVRGGEIYEEKIAEKLCDLITVAFNESVLKEFGMDSPLMEERNMLINLALDYVEDQHKVKLSRSFTVFPKKQPMKGSKEGLERSFMKKYQATDEKFETELSELEKSFGPLAEGCKDTLLAKMANMADGDKSDLKDDQTGDKSLLDKLTNIAVSSPGNSAQSNPSKLQDTDRSSELQGGSSSKPLIQEMNSDESKSTSQTEHPPHASENSSDSTSEHTESCSVRQPDYTIAFKEVEGTEKSLCIKIKLEGVSSVSDCEVHLSQDDLELEVPNRYYLKLTLPCSVNEDNAKAKFQRKTQVLTLNIPVINMNNAETSDEKS